MATVEIGGVVYPVVQGKYKRLWSHPGFAAAGSPAVPGKVHKGRQQVVDFSGGQGRAFLHGGERGSWPGFGVGPALGGQGVEPWPYWAGWTDAGFALAATSVEAVSLVVGNRVYLGIGRYLFRSVVLGAAAWANWSLIWDFGAAVTMTALAAWPGDKIVVGIGSANDAYLFDPAGPSVAIWRVGEKVVQGCAYGGEVVYAPKVGATGASGQAERVKVSLVKYNGAAAVDERTLDAAIVRMAPHAGTVAIATRRSLYLWRGRPYAGRPDDATSAGKDEYEPPAWIGEPEAVFSHGSYTSEDDFAFLLSFQGKLWTWLGDRVVSWDGAAAGWERHPVEGRRCRGGVVAGGYLGVITESYTGVQELWLTDGDGWWRAWSRGSVTHCWPVALYGAGNMDFAVLRAGELVYDLVRVRPKGTTALAYAPGVNGEWVSPAFDGGDRGRIKTWGEAGFVFGAPQPGRGYSASVDTVNVFVYRSIDLGASWTQLAVVSGQAWASLGPQIVVANLGVSARLLQLRVLWESVTDWAPMLNGVWADWSWAEPDTPAGAPGPTPVGKRRWELSIRVSDLAPETALTGDQLSAQLWTQAESGGNLTFRDVDYAVNPVQRMVRVEKIVEEWGAPGRVAASPREATVGLVLQEG